MLAVVTLQCHRTTELLPPIFVPYNKPPSIALFPLSSSQLLDNHCSTLYFHEIKLFFSS